MFVFRFILSFGLGISLAHGFTLPQEDETPRSCNLPKGTPGFCVPLNRCTAINELVENLETVTNDVRLYMQDSFQCPPNPKKEGFEVCCAPELIVPALTVEPETVPRNSCAFQFDIPVTCAPFSECTPILQLIENIRRPIPQAIPILLQNSWLCGFEAIGGVSQPQVCCPNAVLKPKKKVPSDHPNRGLLPLDTECGINDPVQKRIVGGQDTVLGEYPWLVNLGFKSSGGTTDEILFKCGGSLISDQYVLTAAHCVTNLPESITLARIRVGEHDLGKDEDCDPDSFPKVCAEPVQDFNIEKIIPHESYNAPNPFQNDIALIRLDGKVQFNRFASPICLPFKDDEEESYEKVESQNTITDVAGWGATTRTGRKPALLLQKLKVEVFEGAKCREVYSTRGGKLTPLQQMCAGGENGKDSCVGDSGSALMRDVRPLPSIFKIIGVVSFGPRRCGTEGVPGVYTRVRYYLDWILDHIEE
ncbi:hypothetical protein TCAL_09603 [Tigriopus californicus]|uniref:CLIP domain-containing serine protease n=1 Tax=Tigriopus californicus TaxID=6832 RepID=A0A553P2W0_TIGCA|nr:CLIP domain-containing serine protease HP8-like [Tigriopus californicus]TRY72013.1 hypothetical protein TCAL_09603 [Tigriopus californicus]|eukprot:TCALIF_09603-PA protein Name:"Similar to ea Serine protease easter (Drosophila melanogaster)" AED:0.05 eAED:0.05 QI:473/0.83/0.85/1/0.66/0.57/7/80/474